MKLFSRGRSEGGLYKKIAIPFFIVSAIIAAAVFYISFSWVTITLTPEPHQTSYTYPLKVTDSSQKSVSADMVSGKVMSVILEGDGTFSATGTEDIEQRVHGVITIVNKSGKNQQLRETTRLLSADGMLFRTEHFAEVPAGGTVEVSVVADKPGDIPQLSTAKFILPALWAGLQAQIYGTGFEPRTTGSTSIKLISQKDVDAAGASIAVKLEEQFKSSLEKGVGTWTPLSSQFIIERKILSSVSDKPIGTKTDQFSDHAKVLFTGVLFDKADILLKSKEFAPRFIPKGTQLSELRESDVSVKLLGIDTDESSTNIATLTVDIQAQTVLAGDSPIFPKKRLSGMTQSEIRDYFKSYDGIKDTTVRFYPFWVSRAPFLTDHIHILIKK